MTDNTKEDQLDVYRNYFEDKDFQEYSERVAEVLDISEPKFSIKLCTKEGDNYVGVVYRVLIEGTRNNVPVKISTILKVPPRDEKSRLALQVAYFFPREQFFYTEIVKIFEKLLTKFNKFLENIPKCYFVSSVDHKEAIYLQDLQPLGFVMHDRLKQMDFAHMSLAFSALGRFHALSFALRDQMPEVFESKVATLKEPLFRPDLVHSPQFIERLEVLQSLVKMALAEEDPKYTERFIEHAKNVPDLVERSCSGALAEPYAVLAHGDVWTNNLLFKYEKDSVEPREMYFLDFQLARYASPATDISYTLFCSCSQQLREKHFDELIKIYHNSLSAYLRELGSDPEKLFPYDALLDQLKNFSTVAAVMVTLVLSGFTSQGEDVKSDVTEVVDISVLEKRLRRDHFWRNTLRDSIKDLIDRNWI